MTVRSAYSVLLALFLAACASYGGYGLQPGTSTADDVRRVMGPPAMTFDTRDGGQELIYPRGPMGNETYIAFVAADGRLAIIRQVLNDGNFDSLELGLSEEEVLRRLGPPRDGMSYPLSRTHSWDWKYMDTWGYPALFSVTFNAEGRVVSKYKERIERNRNR